MKNDLSLKEKDKNDIENLKMQPCPHCNKMFKWVATHFHSCPETLEGKDKIARWKTVTNDLSSKKKRGQRE